MRAVETWGLGVSKEAGEQGDISDKKLPVRLFWRNVLVLSGYP